MFAQNLENAGQGLIGMPKGNRVAETLPHDWAGYLEFACMALPKIA
jgi:hypothetical protein